MKTQKKYWKIRKLENEAMKRKRNEKLGNYNRRNLEMKK